MQDQKGVTNLEKWNKAKDYYDKAQEKFLMAKEGSKAAENAYNSMKKYEAQLDYLTPIKHETKLSDTCKTHLADLYTRVVYDRTEDLKSKYLEKGLLMEEDAITLYSSLTGEYFEKNKERKFNEFIEGEMDFSDVIVAFDTKVNWSIFQFNRVVCKPIKPLYHWQLDGYMWLYNKKKGRLIYSLLDTPEHLIKREQSKFMYEVFGKEKDLSKEEMYSYLEACEEIRKNHTYSDIPLEKRVKIFDVEENLERREKIKTRVLQCREYLKNFENLNTSIDETDEMED